MEKELFFSGYCRMLDGARTVACVFEDGALTEADCCYGAEDREQIAHVFHVNISLPEATECNNAECAFFRKYV